MNAKAAAEREVPALDAGMLKSLQDSIKAYGRANTDLGPSPRAQLLKMYTMANRFQAYLMANPPVDAETAVFGHKSPDPLTGVDQKEEEDDPPFDPPE